MTDYLKTVRAYEGNAPYIFVSYAHKDSDTVLPLIDALQKGGYNVWFDNGIQAGSEWPVYIEERLTDCSMMLVFISEAAVASRNCRNEVNLALKLNKDFLVVHLEETVLRYGMELQLGSMQALFKYRQPDAAEFVNNLLNAEALRHLRIGEKSGAKNTSAPTQKSVGNAPEHKAQPTRHQQPFTPPVQPKTTPEKTATTASNNSKKEIPAEKTKRTNAIKYTVLTFSVIAFLTGSLLMYFLTPQYNGGSPVNGLLITVGLILPVILLLAIPVSMSKNKSLTYSVGERQQIYDDVCSIVVFCGLIAIIVDAFLVRSTESVFFKILISLGINVARYFITMMFTPDEPKV